MNENTLVNNLSDLFLQFKQDFFGIIPGFLLAIFILLIGFLVARIIKALTNRFVKNLGRFIPYKNIKNHLQPAKLEPSATLISNILYWIIIFFFLTIATETSGLPVITTLFSSILNYLPKIVVAVLICVIGIIGGVILRDLITSTATSAGITYGGILGKIGQFILLSISILIGINYVGIDITILTNIILILLSAILFGAALAFALGAKTSVSNILATHYLQKRYKIGQIIKINNIEGRIIKITPTNVIIETSEGQVCVPSAHFSECQSILVKEDS